MRSFTISAVQISSYSGEKLVTTHRPILKIKENVFEVGGKVQHKKIIFKRSLMLKLALQKIFLQMCVFRKLQMKEKYLTLTRIHKTIKMTFIEYKHKDTLKKSPGHPTFSIKHHPLGMGLKYQPVRDQYEYPELHKDAEKVINLLMKEARSQYNKDKAAGLPNITYVGYEKPEAA